MTRPVPYPADTRAKGWRFELDHERIEQSDTWALTPAEIRPWLLMLWLTAWRQTPCGALPADDELIAAKIGMPAKAFAKAKSKLMRGWWLAEDGRLYHDTLILRVTEMMGKRRSDSDRQAKRRAGATANHADVTRDTDVIPAGVGPEFTTGTGTGTLPSTLRAEGGARPTPAEACIAIKAAGMAAVNPSSPKLLALLEAGMTLGELTEAARDAVADGKPFNYALATAEGRRRDAAAVKPLPTARRTAANAQSFAERDRDAGMARWEEMTGRVHPDRQPGGGAVIDITPAHQRLEAP